ncbi:selenoprotein K-like [Neocloeon triangulifer]|uniref:selenoprotein K-like n=1 Tax=Neocloeon triangulifer TaxID=2078957 RepID=UPI00286F3A64|nr:selenoprotein K-like [Neocloeon triangulifer]
MVYVSSGGTLGGSKSPWQLSTWVDWFWGFINFIVLFFRTLFNPKLNRLDDGNKQYSRDHKPPGGGPPRPPTRRTGGFGTISSLPGPPMGGG